MMQYKRGKVQDESQIYYTVWEDGVQTADFTCTLQDDGLVWVEEIRLMPGYDLYEYFSTVMDFIKYKAHVSGPRPICMKVDSKNHRLHTWLEGTGFRQIDLIRTVGAHNREIVTITMKCG